MSLSAGSRLGPYEIVSVLGAGGMGAVYRAVDSRLQREVAIKVSGERFAERFEIEARSIAALNHPNVCTLHDIGPNYLVMELVEGPTLADRLAQGPLPLDEALRIAAQLQLALAAAHERGIVHRDLKPGNIKLKADGTVKVLDFGLAKIGGTPTAAATDLSPTIGLAATHAGVTPRSSAGRSRKRSTRAGISRATASASSSIAAPRAPPRRRSPSSSTGSVCCRCLGNDRSHEASVADSSGSRAGEPQMTLHAKHWTWSSSWAPDAQGDQL